jgi:hypothetical protein
MSTIEEVETLNRTAPAVGEWFLSRDSTIVARHEHLFSVDPYGPTGLP